MPILNKEAIDDLKWSYNYNLNRYYKGCKYCDEHKNEINKWLPELLDVLDNINKLLEEILKYEEVTEKEITKGFLINKKEGI